MRILHLISYPLWSGPVPPTVGLALAQRQLGHTVWLACDSKRGAFNAYEEAALPVLAGLGLEPPVALTLSTKSCLGELWADWRQLSRLRRTACLDVLHVHMSHDHALASWARCGAALGPCWGRGSGYRRVAPAGAPLLVRTIHAARSLQPRLGQRWQNRRAQGWLVRHHSHAEQLMTRFGVPAERVAVVPGGVDGARFTPPDATGRAAARRRWGLPLEGPVLGHVALMAGRGQEELLEAMALRRSRGEAVPQLFFVGRGEREESLRARVAALGLTERVCFAGYVAGEALVAAYAAMDAAFLAQAGNDASARAGLEALACGRPLVAVAQEPLLRELASADFGFPVAERTASAIAAALGAWLAQGPREAARRGAQGRAWVARERSFAGEAERVTAFYEALRR